MHGLNEETSQFLVRYSARAGDGAAARFVGCLACTSFADSCCLPDP